MQQSPKLERSSQNQINLEWTPSNTKVHNFQAAGMRGCEVLN